MNKIEKVEMGDVFYSGYFNSWCQVVGFAENGYFYFKKNEFGIPIKSRIKTDYLIENNLIFRNRELHSEENIIVNRQVVAVKKGDDTIEVTHRFKIGGTLKDEFKKPEKQEEWRELSEDTKRILITLGYYFSDGEEHHSCPVCGIDVVKLDQLLSERTPSKEDITGAVARGYTYKVNENKVLDVDLCKAIVGEISKLLKEQE